LDVDGGDDVALEMGMYRAYHRWINDYCAAYPDRLGAVMLSSARDVAGSIEEMRRWSKSALGVGHSGVRAVRHAARSSGSRAALGGSGGARSGSDLAHVHRNAAVCAGRSR
jgi:hypothetical protein